MAEEHTSGDMADVRRELGEIKSILEEIRTAVVTDHQKIEELEATKDSDHQKLKDLEETRKNLEMTGRIQVRPIGL